MNAIQLFVLIFACWVMLIFTLLITVAMVFTGKEKIIKAEIQAEQEIISMRGAAAMTLEQYRRGELKDD